MNALKPYDERRICSFFQNGIEIIMEKGQTRIYRG
jgi:hypothetical protein